MEGMEWHFMVMKCQSDFTDVVHNKIIMPLWYDQRSGTCSLDQ